MNEKLAGELKSPDSCEEMLHKITAGFRQAESSFLDCFWLLAQQLSVEGGLKVFWR